MLYFENDYCEGAHEAIFKKINGNQYGKGSGIWDRILSVTKRRKK